MANELSMNDLLFGNVVKRHIMRGYIKESESERYVRAYCFQVCYGGRAQALVRGGGSPALRACR